MERTNVGLIRENKGAETFDAHALSLQRCSHGLGGKASVRPHSSDPSNPVSSSLLYE